MFVILAFVSLVASQNPSIAHASSLGNPDQTGSVAHSSGFGNPSSDGFSAYAASSGVGSWIRQGVVMTAFGSEQTTVARVTVLLRQSNCIILPAPCLAMWYSANQLSTTMCYAESTSPLADPEKGGKYWIKYSLNPLSVTGYQGHVVQIGSEFRMYIIDPSGSFPVNLYVSTDGVTWVLDASSPVLNVGNSAVESITAFVDFDDTVWLFTDGSNALYHSSDGKSNWSLISRPFIGNGGSIVKVAGRYYSYGYKSGQLWPADIWRFSASAMEGTWSEDLGWPAYPRATFDEGLDNSYNQLQGNGQVWGQSYVDFTPFGGNGTYMWYTATADGRASPEAWVYYIKLATYQGSFQSLIATGEQSTSSLP